MSKIDIETLKRCCRMYKSNADAARALGMTGNGFSRLCRKKNVESPHKRLIRQRQERNS